MCPYFFINSNKEIQQCNYYMCPLQLKFLLLVITLIIKLCKSLLHNWTGNKYIEIDL